MKKQVKQAARPPRKVPASSAGAKGRVVAKSSVNKAAASKKAPVKKVAPKKAAAKKVAPKPSVQKKAPAKKVAAKKTAVKKTAVKKVVPAKKSGVAKPVAKSGVAKKVVAKKAQTNKPANIANSLQRKSPAKKTVVGKAATRSAASLGHVKKKGGVVAKKKNHVASSSKSALGGSESPKAANETTINKGGAGFPGRTWLDPANPGKIARAILRPNISKEKKPIVLNNHPTNQTAAPDLLEKDEGANPGFFQTDEVFDETDYAQHLQLMEQADVSRRARELNRPQTHPDFDGQHCIECEIQIPLLRLQAGRIRCVDCQEEIENEDRRNQNMAKGRGF